MGDLAGSGRSIDAVIFDVGGVLTNNPIGIAARRAVELGIDLKLFAFLVVGFGQYDAGDHPWHRFERGEIELAEYEAGVQALASEHGVENIPAMPTPEAFGDLLTLRAEMIDVVAHVKSLGLRTAILTNNVKPWGVWRTIVPVEEFDVVVDSCEVGMRKPEARIFEHVAGLLELPVGRCLLLDDFPENVEGARRIGMHAIRVDESDSAIRELHELLGGTAPA